MTHSYRISESRMSNQNLPQVLVGTATKEGWSRKWCVLFRNQSLHSWFLTYVSAILKIEHILLLSINFQVSNFSSLALRDSVLSHENRSKPKVLPRADFGCQTPRTKFSLPKNNECHHVPRSRRAPPSILILRSSMALLVY